MRKLYTAKRIIQLSVLFCFLLIPVNIKAQAHVYVNPPTTILSGQSSVTIDFMISNVSNLHSYSVKVRFDNSILSYQTAVKGPFLTTGGYSSAFFTSPNPIIDSVEVAEAILGPYVVNGSGKLFSITFNVLSAGNSTIDIALVLLRDLSNNDIPVTWTSGQVVVPVSVNAKVLLQGPFSTNSMNTNLNSLGYLPLNQPYFGAPWNYTGTESVAAGFFSAHPNIVDWTLVELRTGTGASTTVERRAGFITNTGVIVNIDGVSPLYFTELKGNYYLVIFHRNHIPIMSSNPAYLDYVSIQYDFTNAQSKAYGTNPMKDLGGGYFGAYTGDSDGSGTVNAVDRSNTWNQRNLTGYYGTDMDLSGTVNAADRSVIWNNRNLSTQVPN
jgi:hypothetical protein